jgi:hypothetical protein
MRRYGGVAVKPKLEKTEAHYRRQIVLCEKLLDCVVRERQTLIDLDVDRLWSVTEEKQRILRSSEELQTQMEGHRSRDSKEVSSLAGRGVAGKLSLKLELLQKDIKKRVAENARFVGETLGFFDELVSLLAIGAQGPDSYPATGRTRKGALPLIYSKEV